MKKSFISLMFILAIFFPAYTQYISNEEVPEESLTLKKGNIPPAVLKMADDLFKGHTQVKWGVFPYELKDYGWVVNKDYNEPIDHYEVFMKASDGTDVYAIFESNGELIRYRTVNKNAGIPESILSSIAKTEYKDWKVARGTEVVKSNQKKVVEHYTVRLEQDNKKKTLYFTLNGDLLSNN